MVVHDNRYEIERIIGQIDGYLIRRPLEGFEPAFDRAKSELVSVLERHLANVKQFTIDDFKKHCGVKRAAKLEAAE